jgi:peptidoglycan hydrolase-like protein with peptidoglycan-binding domain
MAGFAWIETTWRVLLAGALAAALGWPAAAFAQGTRPPAPDPAFEAARAEFDRLPESDRRSAQDALIWTGDYNGTVGGTFGRRSHDAILAFQKRSGLPPTGILDGPTRAALAASAGRARTGAGFAIVQEPASGVSIGVPAKLLPKRSASPRGGARWQSADGRATLDTARMPGGAAELKTYAETTLLAESVNRRVTYKLVRPDLVVVAGETATGKFYSRYIADAEAVRGFSLGYDKALAPEFDRIVIAVANSFGPASEAAALPSSGPQAPIPPAASRTPMAPLSGLVLGRSRVLTLSAVAGCPDIRVAGRSARLVRSDPARGLALLDTDLGTRAGAPLAEPAPGSSPERVALFSSPEADGRVVAAPGLAVASGQVEAPLGAGAPGGALLDRTGGFIGLLGPDPEKPIRVAGLTPPRGRALVPAGEIAVFLGTDGRGLVSGAPGGERRSIGDLAGSYGPAVLPVTCGAGG